jgi:hypothetical protein
MYGLLSNKEAQMKRFCLLLVPALLLSSLLSSPSRAEERTGTVFTYLYNIFGLHPNGSPYPGADAACVAKFGDYRGIASNTYTINTQTLKMSDETTFHGRTYRLHPLGIAGRYAFGYYQRPANPIYGVLFTISTDFFVWSNRVIFVLNSSTNCALTSLPTL